MKSIMVLLGQTALNASLTLARVEVLGLTHYIISAFT